MPDILAMLTSERDKLNRAIEALGGEIGHAIIRITKTAKRRTMSAEARAKIAAAQKARWARTRVKSAEKSVKKFTMSAAAKAKIAAAQRARWARIKAGK
jgi:hypothetical protein